MNDVPRAMVADGNNLYVIGSFSTAGSLTVNQLARWDGTSWSAVGSGADPLDMYQGNGRIEALAVAKGNVYVGGHFASYKGGGRRSTSLAGMGQVGHQSAQAWGSPTRKAT